MQDSIYSGAATGRKRVADRGLRVVARPKWVYRFVAKWFGGEGVEETVETSVWMAGAPRRVWDCLMTYEEIPVKAPWLLRWLLPEPIGTSGDKTRPGEEVPCTYAEGGLVKQILTVHAPHQLTFAVLDQNLGVEACVVAQGGAYRIEPEGEGSRVTLLTRYVAKLHPRWLWRRVEVFLGHRFHEHVLGGMRVSLRGEL